MSEYQRYEFMTADRPLTAAQLAEVKRLSSHIEATSSVAMIEYSWGDFKHDPLDVLYHYFDGFLYWTNWSEHRLAFRFPHGLPPANLLKGYDLVDYATWTARGDYDLLDIHFEQVEPLDDWVEYELGALMPLREELLEGDARPLYIVWLAAQANANGSGADGGEDLFFGPRRRAPKPGVDVAGPPVPAGLAKVTPAQRALTTLLRLPPEYLRVAAHHSPPAVPVVADDFAAWLDLLAPDQQRDYLLRLARNEPGLSRQLVRELRALRPGATVAAHVEQPRLDFTQIAIEVDAMRARMEAERLERDRQARLRHLDEVHTHPDEYWRRVSGAVERGSGTGYDEAAAGLVELREVARHFDDVARFDARFREWIPAHMRRRAFVARLRERGFTLPEP